MPASASATPPASAAAEAGAGRRKGAVSRPTMTTTENAGRLEQAPAFFVCALRLPLSSAHSDAAEFRSQPSLGPATMTGLMPRRCACGRDTGRSGSRRADAVGLSVQAWFETERSRSASAGRLGRHTEDTPSGGLSDRVRPAFEELTLILSHPRTFGLRKGLTRKSATPLGSGTTRTERFSREINDEHR